WTSPEYSVVSPTNNNHASHHSATAIPHTANSTNNGITTNNNNNLDLSKKSCDMDNSGGGSNANTNNNSSSSSSSNSEGNNNNNTSSSSAAAAHLVHHLGGSHHPHHIHHHSHHLSASGGGGYPHKPSSWESSNGGKVNFDVDEYKLEYMDLDEFLTENNMNIESVLHEQQQPQQQAAAVAALDEEVRSRSGLLRAGVRIPPTPSPQATSGGASLTSLSKSYHRSNSKPYTFSEESDVIRLESEQMHHHQGSHHPGTADLMDHHHVHAHVHTASHHRLPPGFYGSPTDAEDSSRKKKKILVSDEKKDDKYWERRRKNNMAAKRSRDARRAKENQIAIKASFLERDNKALAHELSKARAENQILRERLSKYEII
ncbi:Uncharacterized protein FKW44_001211, partial [Caligus rogercresseyi]